MRAILANIIVYDVGSTYTKASAFNLDHGKFTFLGRGQGVTTLKNVMEGIECAENSIKSSGIEFADNIKRYSSCSAAGGLRMVALGFMPRVTVKAAREVSMTAGARVMQVVSADEPVSFRKEVLLEINPDIILLSGGTDGGDETSVMENAQMICDIKSRATVIVACNKYAQREVAEMFDLNGIKYVRVPNIMPTIHELNVKPARTAIHEQFIKQITKARGLNDLTESLSDKTVVPTPGAVLLACELLAKGTYEHEGIGSLMLLDIGGATTDIHSCLPELLELSIEELGLVISNEKQFSYRTVEGNLGLRVSATGIPETVGPKAIIREAQGDFEYTDQEVLDFAFYLEENPNYIPETPREKALEFALATSAMKVALRRHAGSFSKENDTVMGIMAGTAIGRDLRLVKRAVCVGGIFAHSSEEDIQNMVKPCFEDIGISLLPIEMPEIITDKDYILYALGVLGKHYPDAAFKFLKEYVGVKDPD